MPNIEGTGFEGRADTIRAFVKDGMPAYLIRERDNKFDDNAIAVYIRIPKLLGLYGQWNDL